VILAGDSAETLKTVPDQSVKLIITSPPYNLGKVYEEAAHLDAYLKNLTPVVDQLIRVLADDGSPCC
jgi:DNA modification methylase